jgi:hypothetical protein
VADVAFTSNGIVIATFLNLKQNLISFDTGEGGRTQDAQQLFRQMNSNIGTVEFSVGVAHKWCSTTQKSPAAFLPVGKSFGVSQTMATAA